MVNAEVHWEYLEKNLDRVLAFANNFGNAYAMASAQVRRNLNQSMSEEIAVEVDGSIAHAGEARKWTEWSREAQVAHGKGNKANPGATLKKVGVQAGWEQALNLNGIDGPVTPNKVVPLLA